MENLKISILGNMKTLKILNVKNTSVKATADYFIKQSHVFGYGDNKEIAEKIFAHALQIIESNIGKGITQMQYDEFITNGSVLSFWVNGVCYEMKKGKIKIFDNFS